MEHAGVKASDVNGELWGEAPWDRKRYGVRGSEMKFPGAKHSRVTGPRVKRYGAIAPGQKDLR